jgi:hypothetical protein
MRFFGLELCTESFSIPSEVCQWRSDMAAVQVIELRSVEEARITNECY